MSRLGSYVDTLELENEILRDKVKALEAKLKPFLIEQRKREERNKFKEEMDTKISQMLVNLHNQIK
jgi:AICAR transformylase/IMP cyclohydrolase PurH